MKRENVLNRFKFQEMWQNHCPYITLMIAAFAFDAISTIYFMYNEGVHCELHPLVRHSALIFGPVAGTILAAFIYKCIVTLSLALYLPRLRSWILTVPVIPAIVAGFINFLLPTL